MSGRRRESRISRLLSQKQSLTPDQLIEDLGTTDSGIDGNCILPHTIEAGDQYYLGDVYRSLPSPYAQEWELHDGIKRPYLNHLKDVSSAWPHLRYLAEWMEVTTTPLKWKHIKDNEVLIRAERASRTKVAVADFNAARGVTIQSFDNTSDLALAIEKQRTTDIVDTHRLYIVEDLSRDVIELLGSQLDIDPLVFREQISDYLWFNSRDPWVELPDLRMISKQRSFFHLRYLQPRYFEASDSYVRATHQAGLFNVLRRMDSDRKHKTAWDTDGACVGLVRSRTSFWWTPAVPGERGTIGVLLVDPTIREGFPLWTGYRNFQPTPPLSQSGPFDAPPRSSLFEAVIYWYRRVLPAQMSDMGSDPRAMLIPIAQVICAEWLTTCRYITGRLNQIEWELENPYFRRDPDGINASLSKLHPLRRGVPLYIEMVREIISRLFPDDVPLSEGITSLRPDFEIVEKTVGELQDRIERIVAVATAIISIEDSRREINLNMYLGRLSYIAVLFVPLSFVSSLYSMAPDLSQLAQTFWIYFTTAVPMTILAFLIIDGKSIVRWSKKKLGKTEQVRI